MTFWLWTPHAGGGFTPRRATMHLMAADDPVESRVLSAAALAALAAAPPRFAGHDAGLWLAQQVTVPREPAVTRIECELEVAGADGSRTLAATMEVSEYVQRVALIFPVKGNFAIVFGHASEGDHLERSQAFAYDIAPLGRRYELLPTGDGTRNEHFAGWGREIRAPAGGVVVRLQADVPDNPIHDRPRRAPRRALGAPWQRPGH
jgi:hypothetical protein